MPSAAASHARIGLRQRTGGRSRATAVGAWPGRRVHVSATLAGADVDSRAWSLDHALERLPPEGFDRVSDIGRAVVFYEGKLGLQALDSGPSATIPDGSRVYGSGGGPALNVYQSLTAGSHRRHWQRYVDDIDQVIDELTAVGVEFVRYDEFEHDPKGITPRAGVVVSRGSRTRTATPSPSKPTPEHRLLGVGSLTTLAPMDHDEDAAIAHYNTGGTGPACHTC